MVNSRDKGLKAERDLVRYLKPWFPKARRLVSTGWSTETGEHQDEGDIAGTPYLCWQVKNQARPLVGKALGDVWEETRVQAKATGSVPLLAVKRAGTADVGRWTLYMSSWCYLDMMIGTFRRDSDHLLSMDLGDVIEHLSVYSACLGRINR